MYIIGGVKDGHFFIRKMFFMVATNCWIWVLLVSHLVEWKDSRGWRGFGCMAVYKQCPRVFAWLHVLRLGCDLFPDEVFAEKQCAFLKILIA